jgi:hypothetical protein
MRRYLVANFLLVFVMTFTLFGCTKRYHEFINEDVVSQVISTMNRASTYEIDITLRNNNTWEINNARTFSHKLWQGQAQVNFTDNSTYFSMDIKSVSGSSFTLFTWQEYIVEGWDYHNQIVPMYFNCKGQITWTKKLLTDNISWSFVNTAYVLPQIKILQIAAQTVVISTVHLHGLDCYLLELVPAPDTAIDWVLSQSNKYGPNLGWWMTTLERTREIYEKAYQSGSVKLWVDRKSYQIILTEVNLNFVVKSSDISWEDMETVGGPENSQRKVGFDQIVIDFQGKLHFSSYDEHLSIVPPLEALNARIH